MKKFIVSFFALLFFSLVFTGPLVSQSCPSWVISAPKDNELYLYMPLIADPVFPEWGTSGINTSPLAVFDVADLDSSIGTTAQLRQRIYEMVVDDYCEFNVDVNTMTLGMSPAASNWQIVGIGTDSETVGTGILFGIAQAVDTNDNVPQDYAREYCASFSLAYPTAFSGVNSTLERWANAIAGTASHEAGHNYGLSHGNASPQAGTGEDAVTNHIMATGSSGLTGEQRASIDRHFSDTSYEILGHNLGLNTETLHNWDFINPNSTTACRIRLKILSTSTTLTINWFYNGWLSPWTSPTVTAAGTTEIFHGTTYNVFYLDFTVGKTWANGPSGQVPAGEEFHIGASFAESTAIVVKETTLFDCSSSQLPLNPRIAGYDAGTLDVSSGDFVLQFLNPDPGRPMILRNLTVMQVPRMIDIETMMNGMEPMARWEIPINIISSFTLADDIWVQDTAGIVLANLSDPRHVDITYTPQDCEPGYYPPADGTGMADVNEGEWEYCPEGTALSLFPSTYTYVIAEVIDPDACYWDPVQERFVEGPLASKIFYQFSGIVPDLNENGIDDLLDIRNGNSPDRNLNGVADDVEERLLNGKVKTLNPRALVKK